MQHDNFWNLNKVTFGQRKRLESRVNVFWYCFKVIKRYVLHYLMKSVSIPGSENSFEILQLFDTMRYQSFVVLCFSSVLTLI